MAGRNLLPLSHGYLGDLARTPALRGRQGSSHMPIANRTHRMAVNNIDRRRRGVSPGTLTATRRRGRQRRFRSPAPRDW